MDIKAALVGAGAVVLLAGGIFGASAYANDAADPAPVVVEPTVKVEKVVPPVVVVTPPVEAAVPVPAPAVEPLEVVVPEAPVEAAPPPAAPVKQAEPDFPLPAPTVNVDENGAANGDPNNAGSSE